MTKYKISKIFAEYFCKNLTQLSGNKLKIFIFYFFYIYIFSLFFLSQKKTIIKNKNSFVSFNSFFFIHIKTNFYIESKTATFFKAILIGSYCR